MGTQYTWKTRGKIAGSPVIVVAKITDLNGNAIRDRGGSAVRTRYGRTYRGKNAAVFKFV